MPTRYPQLILHVGPPRAGTTTLQKYVFPGLDNHLSLSKLPFDFHARSVERYPATHQVSETGHVEIKIPETLKRLTELRKAMEDEDDRMRNSRQEVFTIIRSLAAIEDYNEGKDVDGARQRVLRTALMIAAEAASRTSRKVLIASESFSNSRAGLLTESYKTKKSLGLLETEIISQQWKILTGGEAPLISFALRRPIEHLCSRYLRYFVNKKEIKKKPLKLETWVGKQIDIDRASRKHSGLFPILHKSFVSFHSKIGFIKPYSFTELAASNDVCNTIGLAGEKIVRFNELPKENEITIKQANKELLHDRIKAALEREGYLGLVLDEQIMN